MSLRNLNLGLEAITEKRSAKLRAPVRSMREQTCEDGGNRSGRRLIAAPARG